DGVTRYVARVECRTPRALARAGRRRLQFNRDRRQARIHPERRVWCEEAPWHLAATANTERTSTPCSRSFRSPPAWAVAASARALRTRPRRPPCRRGRRHVAAVGMVDVPLAGVAIG